MLTKQLGQILSRSIIDYDCYMNSVLGMFFISFYFSGTESEFALILGMMSLVFLMPNMMGLQLNTGIAFLPLS